MRGPVYRLGAIFHIELLVNVIDVSLDGVHTEAQLFGDVSVFRTGGKQVENFHFPYRKQIVLTVQKRLVGVWFLINEITGNEPTRKPQITIENGEDPFGQVIKT